MNQQRYSVAPAKSQASLPRRHAEIAIPQRSNGLRPRQDTGLGCVCRTQLAWALHAALAGHAEVDLLCGCGPPAPLVERGFGPLCRQMTSGSPSRSLTMLLKPSPSVSQAIP